LLGISRIDRETSAQFLEAEWRAGRLRITEMELRRVVGWQAESVRPGWVAAYWAESPEFKDGVTVASVGIDDETGLAELSIHRRPRE
jgi:hypothetical protein